MSEQNNQPTILGWIARLFSVIFILGLAALIGWKIVTEHQDIQFKTAIVQKKIHQVGDQFLVPVDVTNEGSRTARRVDMDLTMAGEKTSIEIDLIGAKETVRVMVPRSKRPISVSQKVTSYEAP